MRSAGGIHTGWMAVPSTEPVSTLIDLTVNEMVHVKDVHGRSVNGVVADVSLTVLTIIDENALSVLLPADEVQTVSRQDSVMNGVLLGLAGGLIGAAVMGRNVCGDEDAACAGYIALPVGLGGGGRPSGGGSMR